MSEERRQRWRSGWKKAERSILLALLGLAVLAIAGLIVKNYWRSRRDLSREAVATVDGQEITRKEFERALYTRSGPQVMEALIQEKVILAEAARRNLTVEENELGLGEPPTDPMLRNMVSREARARVLLRKLLLVDVSEDRKRHLFQVFRDELIQYDLYCVYLSPASDGESEATDPPGESEARGLGWLTRPDLQARLGTPASQMVLALDQGVLSEPVPTPYGAVRLKVAGIRSTYEELESSVEDLLVEAGRQRLMYRLLTEADTNSPYVAKEPPDPAAVPTALENGPPAASPTPPGDG